MGGVEELGELSTRDSFLPCSEVYIASCAKKRVELVRLGGSLCTDGRRSSSYSCVSVAAPTSTLQVGWNFSMTSLCCELGRSRAATGAQPCHTRASRWSQSFDAPLTPS